MLVLASEGGQYSPTEDDLATVEDTDNLISWRAIRLDLEQFCHVLVLYSPRHRSETNLVAQASEIACHYRLQAEYPDVLP